MGAADGRADCDRLAGESDDSWSLSTLTGMPSDLRTDGTSQDWMTCKAGVQVLFVLQGLASSGRDSMPAVEDSEVRAHPS